MKVGSGGFDLFTARCSLSTSIIFKGDFDDAWKNAWLVVSISNFPVHVRFDRGGSESLSNPRAMGFDGSGHGRALHFVAGGHGRRRQIARALRGTLRQLPPDQADRIQRR